MLTSPLRRLLGIAAAALVLSTGDGLPTAEASRRAVQLGVFTTGRDAHVDAVLAGMHEGFRLAGWDVDVLEKTSSGSADEALVTVKEFAFEGVDVVFALGPDAACLARDALRETSVVFAAVGYPEALGLPGRGNVCGVAGGVPADEVVETIRRVAPAAQAVGIVGGDTDADRDLALRVRTAAEEGGLRTAFVDREIAAETRAGEVVWIAPDVPAAEVDALSRTLRDRRAALIGSTRAHLDAGCSVVLRTDPKTEGLQAAALARRVLAGEAPQQVGVRRLRRHRLEISLDAARRLAHEIPLPVLAAADHLAPSFGRQR